jgi:hypothetical protein
MDGSHFKFKTCNNCGLLHHKSSVFDFLTFGVLLWPLHATPGPFRTGWFLESVVSAALIVLVVRTRKPFFQSRPGRSCSSPRCWGSVER